MIHLSISLGKAPPLMKTVMPFPGEYKEKRRVAWTQALAKMPVVWSGCDAKSRVHAFAAISASGSYFEPSCDGLAAFRRRDHSAPGSCRKLPGIQCSSHQTRRRHIHPIKATVATETPFRD